MKQSAITKPTFFPTERRFKGALQFLRLKVVMSIGSVEAMQEKALEEMESFIIKYKRKRRLKRREPRLLKTIRTPKFKKLNITREEWRNGI